MGNRATIWLRAESKPMEARAAVTPSAAAQLLEVGYEVIIEASPQRSIDLEDYVKLGCQAAPEHSWRDAPDAAIIVGLKELPDSAGPFRHRHVHFAHVFKDQRGWQSHLKQYDIGGGKLYDLEFLVDEAGVRVAAFGYWAGFAGAGLACLAWAGQQHGQSPSLGPVTYSSDQLALLEAAVSAFSGATPSVAVIGAQGRCGRGAVEFCLSCGLNVAKWGRNETASGGPFETLLDYDILINCVYLKGTVTPFITTSELAGKGRRLRVISDVSCDPDNRYNPLPLYSNCTTFEEPCLRLIDGAIQGEADLPLDIIAIDHLPSLLPRESSEDFSRQLLPYLLQIDALDSGVWARAGKLFDQKLAQVQVGGVTQ